MQGGPVVTLPPRLLWPMQWAVANRDGGVGAMVYLSAVNMIASRLAPALIEATGFAPAKPPATLLDKFLSMTGLSGIKALMAK